jgi:hypothetical protein
MFGSAILDVAVGLVFVYLVVSLMVTAVTELLSSWKRWRASTLFLGIQNLLDAKGSTWAAKLYAHPLIAGLSPLVLQTVTTAQDATAAAPGADPKAGPSYIPSRTFAIALLETVRGEVREQVEKTLGNIADPGSPEARAAVDALPLSGAAGARIKADLQQILDRARTSGFGPADLQRLAGQLFDEATDRQTLDLVEAHLAGTHLGKAFSALLTESERDAAKLKENLEVWFNNSMDRVTGWYKRKTQWVHLLLAAALTVGINVDSIQIVQNLSHDTALRDSLVAQAQTWAKENPSGPPTDASFDKLRGNLESLNLPIGWWYGPKPAATSQAAYGQAFRRIPLEAWDDLGNGDAWVDLLKTLRFHFWGWLLTAIAISLGAPFWFDVLNKVITIRSSGKAPEETPKPPKEVPQPLAPGQSPLPAPTAGTKA